MKKLLLALSLFLFLNTAYAQDSISGSRYYTWVTYLDQSASKKGFLIELSDPYISYIPKADYQEWLAGNGYPGMRIPFSNIESLKFRKNNRVAKGILIGGLIGGVGGGLVSMNAVSLFDDGTSFLLGFVPGVVTGGLIGAMIGSSKIKVSINGDQSTYHSQRERLKKYILFPD